MTLYVRQQKRHRYIEQSFELCGRRWQWDFWENNIETCILSNVKQISSPGSMNDTGCSGPSTRITLRDGMGREMERGIQGGEHMYPHGWFMSVYGKNHYNIVNSVQFSSVAQSCLTLCDPMNRSMPGLPVHHQLLEFTQTHAHRVCWCHRAISSYVIPFSSCPQSLPASESFPSSQLFAWDDQSIGVSAPASSFQWTPRTYLL